MLLGGAQLVQSIVCLFHSALIVLMSCLRGGRAEVRNDDHVLAIALGVARGHLKREIPWGVYKLDY